MPTEKASDNVSPVEESRGSISCEEKHEVTQDTTDRAAERRLRLKIDFMIMPTVALLYLFCFIDRANIGNARIAGLEADLGMEGFDYNATLSIFYVSYIIFEIPSNILCKVLGPGWVIPALTLGFGACSVANAYVTNVPQAMIVRFLLGAFEAGMLPGIAYFLSRWYRRSELTFRLSLYIVMGPLAGAFGGLLASAILTLDSFAGVKTWRMIFLIEGIVTMVLAAVGFLTLTDRPQTAIWLSAEEKELAERRIVSERAGTTQVLDKIDWPKLLRGMKNPVVISTSWIFLFCNITVQGLGFFAPTIVRSIYPERATVQQQLFTVPPYIVGAFFTLLFPLLSWRLDRRQIFMIIGAPLGVIGYIMFLSSDVAHVRYGATFLIASATFSLGALTNGQVSANVVSDTARSSAIGLNVMMGNIGGLISTWSYMPWDAPDFHIGNGLNLATTATTFIVATGTYFWMKRDNKVREEKEEERLNNLGTMGDSQWEDMDYKHPSFRWRL